MKKILVIGWDSADWGIIKPLMDTGMMPGIKSLVEQGASGNIKTLSPSFSPMLWTSIATGKLADKHNVLGFLEPNENGDGIRPISGSSRKVQAIWNILESRNYKCNVIGWWPSHPAEPVNGLMVSNLFQRAAQPLSDGWNMPEGSVWPASLKDEIKKLRVHPSQISAQKVLTFVPEAAKINQDEDNRLQVIQELLAATESVFNTAMWTIKNTAWDFTAVYFNELDQFSHHFMKFHPPQLNGLPDDLYKMYYNVLTAAYTLYDVMLQAILKSVPSDTTIVLLSDHGFYSGERRLKKMPSFNGAIALEHNPFGILCIKGPGIKTKASITNAGLLDITPTLLSIAGLPSGDDMDGEVLREIFIREPEDKRIPTWEKEEKHPENRPRDTFQEAEALKHLIDLGYIESLHPDTEEQIRNVMNDRRYNLSQVYASTGRIEEAIKIMEALYEEDMVDIRYNLDLIKYYLEVKNYVKAREILTSFRKFDISHIPNFDYLEGKILHTEGNNKEALQCYLRAKERSPRFVSLLADTADLWHELKNTPKAIATYKEALSLNPEDPDLHLGLSVVLNKNGMYEDAIEHALDVLKNDAGNAFGHYQIGFALFKMGEYESAANALEACLSLNPNINRARNILLNIYKNLYPDTSKHARHYEIFIQTRKGEIVVVSGLPRSGTSMMMQMLAAGGMEIVTDHKVSPDESNPKGYFEYDPVKRSKTDNSWMDAANGKAVKVITQLLPYLRMKYRLKIIFMERNLNEVLISQQTMIAAKKNSKVTLDLGVKEAYSRHMKEAREWAANKNNVQFICINYNDVIGARTEAVSRVNEFLGGFLDEKKMEAVVDQNLYRIKC